MGTSKDQMANGMVLGIDLGTSSVKITGLSENGILRKAKASYRGSQPECWWTAITEALRDIEEKEGSAGLQAVKAVGFSSQVGTYLFRRSAEEPYAVIPWSDSAGTEELEEILHTYSRACFVREICMMHPHLISYPIPRILYIRKHFPKVERICQPKDYLVEKMTGNFVTDPYSWRGLSNTDKQCYSAFFLRELGVEEGRELPVMRPVSDAAGRIVPVGRLTEAAAAVTHLPEGIPVFCGMNDFYCGLLGMGIVRIGDTFDITGTSEHYGQLEDHLAPDSPVISGPYLRGFVHYGVTGSSGASQDFARRNFPEEMAALEKLVQEDTREHGRRFDGRCLCRIAEKAPVFLPYLNGERAPIYDAGAQGVFFGLRADTERIHMAYAVLEGVVFSLFHIRTCMEGSGQAERHLTADLSDMTAAERLAMVDASAEVKAEERMTAQDPEPGMIRVTGGASVNPVLNLLKATIFDRPVMTLQENDCSALGAAMIAWCGMQEETLEDAVHRFVREEQIYLPAEDGQLCACLRRRFSRYKALYPALKPVFHME